MLSGSTAYGLSHWNVTGAGKSVLQGIWTMLPNGAEWTSGASLCNSVLGADLLVSYYTKNEISNN